MKVETLRVILICSQQQVGVLQQQLIELRDHLSKQTSERQHSATVKAQEQVVLAFWKFFMQEEHQDCFLYLILQFIKKLEEELADAKWETRQTVSQFSVEDCDTPGSTRALGS